MVTVDISQISGECNSWREALRSSRDEINGLKEKLQQAAGRNLSKEQLKDVEHYHNQFHIQLINIHDLKQLIKAHERKVNFEDASTKGQLSEATVAEHEKLFDEYQTLENTLKELHDEFGGFLSNMS